MKVSEQGAARRPDLQTAGPVPLIEFAAGKNKISGFKGNAYYRFYPEKSLYVEVSETYFESMKEANKNASKLEEGYSSEQ